MGGGFGGDDSMISIGKIGASGLGIDDSELTNHMIGGTESDVITTKKP
jgi:hypothetical protein